MTINREGFFGIEADSGLDIEGWGGLTVLTCTRPKT